MNAQGKSLNSFEAFQILSRGYVIPVSYIVFFYSLLVIGYFSKDSENNEFSDTKYFVTERDVQNRAAVDTLPTIELITNEGNDILSQ